MPRKTLALLIGLVFVTVILFIIALRTGQQQTQQQKSAKQTAMEPSPTPDVAHSLLTISPNPVEVLSGGTGSVDVVLDASDNKVTAVQLELLYDPTMVSNVKVTTGPLFPKAVVLLNKNVPQTGRYTYAFGIQANQNIVSGKGTVAKISFTARGVVAKQSQIMLQPTTLVTAQGVAQSVLKSATGTTVVITSSKTSAQTVPLKDTTPIATQ